MPADDTAPAPGIRWDDWPSSEVAPDSQQVIMVIPIARMTTTLADYPGDQPSNRPATVYELAAPP